MQGRMEIMGNVYFPDLPAVHGSRPRLQREVRRTRLNRPTMSAP